MIIQYSGLNVIDPQSKYKNYSFDHKDLLKQIQ